ncbi:MAG: hypothetical protein Q8Q91_02705 [Candidatus Daviesbacteria bacterium]|nr:hypothetical protein [Candidatus Daviesbacteria bacterium]
MEKDDLNKLIRIAESVRQMTSSIKSLTERNGTTLSGYKEPYEVYREQVNHIVLRNIQYQLEFRAVPSIIHWATVLPVYTALESFLDGVIKQETITSQVNLDQLEKEFFIDQNKPFTAYLVVSNLMKQAVSELKIIDAYLDANSLEFLNGINTKVNIKIITTNIKPNKPSFMTALGKFLKEWGGSSLEFREVDYFHDRFIIIDKDQVWFVGSSLNGVGIRASVISQVTDPEIKKQILARFDDLWDKSTPLKKEP